MPTHAHAHTDDPLGLATETGIILTDRNGGPRRELLESLAANGKYLAAAVKILKPVEEWSMSYELHDGATLTLVFGAAVNTNFLITAASAKYSATGRPVVDVSCVKPSAANKIKAYATAITIDFAGGFGLVDKFGATFSQGISSQCSITMQTAPEAMGETDGDYLTGGLYHFGFKKECQAEAYDSITLPAGAHSAQPLDLKTGRDGWKTYAAAWWTYMDAQS